MGAKTDLFPTFSELCAAARDMGKKPLSIPPRPIDGKLVVDENFGIFPREFEDYTYSFLLFEAQKIERRLSADAIASAQQDTAASARLPTPAEQMRNDLHKFVSAQEQAARDDENARLLQPLRERKAPEPQAPGEVADYEIRNPNSRVPAKGDGMIAPGEAPNSPEREEPAKPPDNSGEIPSLPQAKPRVLPPRVPGAPRIPSAAPPALPMQQTPIETPSWQGAPEPSELIKLPLSFSNSNAPVPSPGAPAGAEKKPPAGISSYSKLSPRLQALIEQKLRREEEKAKIAREDADIFKTPPPQPPEEESGGAEPGQEQQEGVDAPNAWNLHDDEEAEGKGAGDLQNARGKDKKLPPPGPAEGERGEIELEPIPKPVRGESPRRMPLRKVEDEIAPMPDKEGGPSPQGDEEAPAPDEEEKEKQMPLQAVPEEKDGRIPSARRDSQAGPITIKPMFPDAAVSGPSQEISRNEDSDRMRRIQRIIEELSPDKMRAQPRREEASFEGNEGEKGPEQAAIAPQKAAHGKKSKNRPEPLKKSAGARKKKAAAAQEKEPPTAVLQRKTAPIGADVQNVRHFASGTAKGGAEGSNPEARQKAASAKKVPSKAKAEELPEEKAETAPKAEKTAPASVIPADEPGGPEEEREAAGVKPPAPRKLAPKFAAREEENEEGEGQEEEAPPIQAPSLRRRILPGMGRTLPSTPQTYVPPARERKQIALPRAGQGEKEMQEEPAAEQIEPAAEQAGISPRIAPLKPRKLVSDEALLASEKTPEQLLQDQKMAKMAEQLARLEAGKVKEVAGTAALPAEEEDVPLPDESEDEVPKPGEYEQAKESLRKTLEHEETARKVKQEDEALVEQYAKDHLVWLYEIYKMGGMGREDFMQKASEKYSEAQNADPAPAAGAGNDAPPNPALAALSKEIEKKDKK